MSVTLNGDRESGRFSQLPADRCALEVRSTTSTTYKFVALNRGLAVADSRITLLSSGKTPFTIRLIFRPAAATATGMPVSDSDRSLAIVGVFPVQILAKKISRTQSAS
jgi:hypothetical protein